MNVELKNNNFLCMLKNKKILIAGLANKHSIAAGIAKAMHAQGAELAFTYQSERLKIAMDEAKNNGSLLPITEIVDKYYEDVQEMILQKLLKKGD